MKVSEAIAEVRRFYTPGVVKFYSQKSPDPWQDAHDQLERAMGQDWEILELAADRFVNRCRELVKAYDATGIRAVPSGAEVGLRCSEERADRFMSRKHRICVKCHGAEGLRIEHERDNPAEVWLVCARCAG